MKKQSGFTLIELMVVMAIIAILATAGLSAYTGYIKKARDAARIADINALNTIVLSSLSVSGSPPASDTFQSLVESMNNGAMIADPLAGTTNLCYALLNDTKVNVDCKYLYISDDGGTLESEYRYCPSGEYMIEAHFESTSNSGLYKIKPDGNDDYKNYWVGTCSLVQV